MWRGSKRRRATGRLVAPRSPSPSRPRERDGEEERGRRRVPDLRRGGARRPRSRRVRVGRCLARFARRGHARGATPLASPRAGGGGAPRHRRRVLSRGAFRRAGPGRELGFLRGWTGAARRGDGRALRGCGAAPRADASDLAFGAAAAIDLASRGSRSPRPPPSRHSGSRRLGSERRRAGPVAARLGRRDARSVRRAGGAKRRRGGARREAGIGTPRFDRVGRTPIRRRGSWRKWRPRESARYAGTTARSRGAASRGTWKRAGAGRRGSGGSPRRLGRERRASR